MVRCRISQRCREDEYLRFNRHRMVRSRWWNSISLSAKEIILVAIIGAVSLFAAQAQAQVSPFGRLSAPTVGGTGKMPAPPTNPFSTLQGNFAPAHKTASGQACITVHPSAVHQIANPNIINHEVLVVNGCGQSIKVQVCYYQSTSCIIVAVNGYEKIERTLGIASGLTDFRYEFREML